MDTEFLQVLKETLERNRGAVLATVIDGQGSVPREAGAKMLIFKDGRTFGTVGGGALEKRIIEEARKLWAEGGTRFFSFNLNIDLGMECGGQVKAFLECIKGAKRMLIFGGGHIGLALYTLCPLLGMTAAVVDERRDFCNEQRFPSAELYPCLPEEAVERLQPGSMDHAVVVTHGHKRDLDCLRRIVDLPLAYLGMIGSRRKVATVMETLRSEGVADGKLKAIHAPVGLDLGGRTPGEIAVAIAAEIIAVQNDKCPPSHDE